MTFVRGIWADLIDKRLWPVALALVVAAVAVPALLHRSSDAADVSAPAPATGTARLPSGTEVSLNREHAQGMLLAGRRHDPFHQLHLPKAATSTSALGPSQAATSASSGASSTSSSGGSSSSGGGSSHKATTASVRVAFGKTGASLKSYDLVPLTALASTSDPLLVFLGVQKDGKTAAFLVSSDAAPQGDGHCSPSRSVCTTLYMKAGDTSFLDVAANGGNLQYELDVKKVSKGS